jgi:signal transduction histidine kinase
LTDTSAHQTKGVPWSRIGEVVAAAIIYYALARTSLLFASLNASATPIWAPTGLAIACILLRGNAMLPAIFLGAFSANFATTPNLATASAVAFGNGLEAYLASLLLHRWAEGERVFYSPLGIAKFATIVVAVAAPTSATIGVLALATTGFAEWREVAAIWMTWWLGDLAGAILITPALVFWARSLRGADAQKTGLATFGAYCGAALVGLAAFSPLSPAPPGTRSALAFLAILPLLWSALRLGLRDTATIALVISSFAVWGVIAGSSPFGKSTLNESLLLLAAFVAASTLPSLALAADRRETQAALEETRQELAQAQKLEALGQMTGGVAHDFNNLLAAIAGGLRSLDRQEEERAKTIASLTQTLERGTRLTKQLLAFARRETSHPERIDLNQAIETVRSLITQSLSETIRVDTRVAPGIWPVRVDRGQLELAVLNLAVNARDAMPEGGSILIKVENVVSGAQGVCIAVTDTGAGMSPDVAARAFEPFYTTKPAGRGTGLGLAQVYSFAKQSGGSASIESAPGRGTTVSVTLPRA